MKVWTTSDTQPKLIPDLSGEFITSEDAILQQEVMSLMQLVNDVNAMAEDLERSTEFSILLISPEARGLESGRTEVIK